jgi:uncharacterized protein
LAECDALIPKTVNEFLGRLKETGIHIKQAYLFGSFARRAENKWSDIDVAVISADFGPDRIEERLRLMRLAAGIDSRIEPVPFRPEAFVDEDPLAWEIKKEGILLIDDLAG